MPYPLDNAFRPWASGSNGFSTNPVVVKLPLVSFAVYVLDENDVRWIEENMGGAVELGASANASESTALNEGSSFSVSPRNDSSAYAIELIRDNALHADFRRRIGEFGIPVECFSMHGNMNHSFAHAEDRCCVYDSELDLFYRIFPDSLEVNRNVPASNHRSQLQPFGQYKAYRILVLAKESQPSARIAVLRIMREIASAQMCLTNWLPLHAAAVAYDQQAILILGERRAGKTTLSLQLLSHVACSFISNDRVFVDGSVTPTPVVHGIPGVVNVRHGSISLLQSSMERSASSGDRDPWAVGHWRARQTLDEAMRNTANATSNTLGDLSLSTRQFLHLTGSSSTLHAPIRLALFPQIIDSDGSLQTSAGFQVQRLSNSETCERLQENIFPIKSTVFTPNCNLPNTNAQGLESLANSLVALEIKVQSGKLIPSHALKQMLDADY
jgi:hypothetical protein